HRHLPLHRSIRSRVLPWQRTFFRLPHTAYYPPPLPENDPSPVEGRAKFSTCQWQDHTHQNNFYYPPNGRLLCRRRDRIYHLLLPVQRLLSFFLPEFHGSCPMCQSLDRKYTHD